jgi:gamma-glutamyltranspeptidase
MPARTDRGNQARHDGRRGLRRGSAFRACSGSGAAGRSARAPCTAFGHGSPIAWESPAYPPGASDTVLLAVVDAQGNAVAFINSVYGSFGSCSTAETLGFPIQNRGFGFTLERCHTNQLEGGKRQYHTIIPAMAMQNGAPSVLFGMTGGFLQPQGHLQLVVNLLDYGMDPQSAIDMPRFWWQGHRDVIIENGFSRGGLTQR